MEHDTAYAGRQELIRNTATREWFDEREDRYWEESFEDWDRDAERERERDLNS